MVIEHTAFGKTKLVWATPHNMEPHEKPDHVLWVERGEDMYALDGLRGKKVAIVHRRDWLKAKEVSATPAQAGEVCR